MYKLQTQNKTLSYDGLELTVKGLLTVEQRNKVTNIAMSAQKMSEGQETGFYGDFIQLLSEIIISWNVVDENDDPLDVTTDYLANVI